MPTNITSLYAVGQHLRGFVRSLGLVWVAHDGGVCDHPHVCAGCEEYDVSYSVSIFTRGPLCAPPPRRFVCLRLFLFEITRAAQECLDGVDGIEHKGIVCCPLECGECAGEGCSLRPGGSSACCGGAIKSSGVMCSDSEEAPCIISLDGKQTTFLCADVWSHRGRFGVTPPGSCSVVSR